MEEVTPLEIGRSLRLLRYPKGWALRKLEKETAWTCTRSPPTRSCGAARRSRLSSAYSSRWAAPGEHEPRAGALARGESIKLDGD